MANADDEITAKPQASAATPMTRRALLKELSKAPGVMGALLLPTHWATPLMEFASVGAEPKTSSVGGTGPYRRCAGTSLTLAFPPGDGSSVSFKLRWYGVEPGSGCKVTLDQAARRATLDVSDTFLTVSLVAGPETVNGAKQVAWNFADSPATKITMTLAVAARDYQYDLDYYRSSDGSDSLLVDMQITGTPGAYSLELSRASSRECPFP